MVQHDSSRAAATVAATAPFGSLVFHGAVVDQSTRGAPRHVAVRVELLRRAADDPARHVDTGYIDGNRRAVASFCTTRSKETGLISDCTR